jgi:nucleoside-diphosphate-sugar epimerase
LSVNPHGLITGETDEQSPRVLITGGSGTLGFNIVKRLSINSANRILVPLRNPHHVQFIESPGLKVAHIDLHDGAQAQRLIEEFAPTTIIHCAASGVRPARPHWFDMLSFNVTATLRLFEASCKLPLCHFIYISTGLVYRDQPLPLTETDPIGSLHPYGASKAAADHLLQAAAAEFGRRLTILRPFSFTGLHDGGNRLFPGLLNAANLSLPFRMSPGEQVRDFCAVQDIAEAVEAVMRRSSRGDWKGTEIFNLGSGAARSIRRIVEDVIEQIGLDVDLRIGDLACPPNEPRFLVANIEKAMTIPWKPRTNLAFAVWELACAAFPSLALQRPCEELS